MASLFMDTTQSTTERRQGVGIAERKLPYFVVAWSGQVPLDAKIGPRLIALSDGLVLGRSGDSGDQRLQSDAKLSREHCRISKVGGDWLVEDLGSLNGTYVGGDRIFGPTIVRDGTTIFMGAQVFVFRFLSMEQIKVLLKECGNPTTGTPTFSLSAAVAYQRVRRLAEAELDLFISGETGTGKEVLARAVHDLSGRKGSFVALNCAALPEPLVESELFGFRRGAHSSARDNKPGLLELARDGTLFLDELGESTSSLQAKLLRFLQDRSFTPLGATAPVKVNTRIIAASHRRNLLRTADGRGLRPDLANRLGPEPIVLPSLRERIEDVGVLAESFLRSMGKRLSDDAMRCLFLSPWEGNIRQLWHRLRYAAAVVGDSPTINVDNLPTGWSESESTRSASPESADPRVGIAIRTTPSQREIEEVLRRCGGDVAATARALGRQRTLVWKWIRRLGIEPSKYRPI